MSPAACSPRFLTNPQPRLSDLTNGEPPAALPPFRDRKVPKNHPTEPLSESAAPPSHLAFVHATAALIKNFLAP